MAIKSNCYFLLLFTNQIEDCLIQYIKITNWVNTAGVNSPARELMNPRKKDRKIKSANDFRSQTTRNQKLNKEFFHLEHFFSLCVLLDEISHYHRCSHTINTQFPRKVCWLVHIDLFALAYSTNRRMRERDIANSTYTLVSQWIMNTFRLCHSCLL